MKSLILTSIICLLSVVSYAGDILRLTNHMSFEGKVTKIKNCTVIFKADGKKYVVPVADIYSVKFEDTADKTYTQYLELLGEEPDNCLQGRADADALHGKRGEHLVLGFLFGPLAMIGTAVSNPRPDSGKHTLTKSENKDLFEDPEYLSCYKKQAKGNLIGSELMGLATWVFVYFSYTAFR